MAESCRMFLDSHILCWAIRPRKYMTQPYRQYLAAVAKRGSDKSKQQSPFPAHLALLLIVKCAVFFSVIPSVQMGSEQRMATCTTAGGSPHQSFHASGSERAWFHLIIGSVRAVTRNGIILPFPGSISCKLAKKAFY